MLVMSNAWIMPWRGNHIPYSVHYMLIMHLILVHMIVTVEYELILQNSGNYISNTILLRLAKIRCLESDRQ